MSERPLHALNAHDLEAQLACFDEDYRSDQPAHPARSFTGRGQVRKNWFSSSRAFLTSGPSSSVSPFWRGGVGEWIWRGTKEDGTALEERGVMNMGSAVARSLGDACTSRKPKEKVLTSPRPCDAWRVGSEFRHQKLALARKLASRRRDSSQPAGSVGAWG